MNKYGFVRVAAVAPELKVADPQFNVGRMVDVLDDLAREGCQVVVFPELCVTGYSCADLFFQDALLEDAKKALVQVVMAAKSLNIVAVIGMPLRADGRLYNVAVVAAGGSTVGVVPKTYLPNRGEFYEERWFTSGGGLKGQFHGSAPFGTDILFPMETEFGKFKMGIELCEDVWSVLPPSSFQAVAGASVLVNLSASDALVGKAEYRAELVRQQSARTLSAYVYASAGPCESTTDLVYSGHLMIAENGIMLAEKRDYGFKTSYIMADVDVSKLVGERLRSSSFAKTEGPKFRDDVAPITLVERLKANVPTKLIRKVPRTPFVPGNPTEREERCREIFAIQSTGLAKRLRHMKQDKVVLGLSGGLDSTLALLVCVEAFDKNKFPRRGIKAVTMPGFGTTDRTRGNAQKLAEELGVDFSTVDIKVAVLQHFQDIGHDQSNHDVVYENCQARERTQVLMDRANQIGALVVGTGDLSELALGWCTYNADHMSMYNVNAGVPKTLVRYLVEWYESLSGPKVLKDICDTPISPELLPPDKDGNITQITEDKVGPYELHDFFLYNVVRCGFAPEKVLFLAQQAFGAVNTGEIKMWLKVFYERFFSQQFKRSCMPDGPKVGSVALSPRGDWRMPSDASAELWMKGL